MISLKCTVAILLSLLASSTFAATKTGDAPTNLMQERAEALTDAKADLTETKTLFDSKEVNLDKIPTVKESEVPVHFDANKDKASEKSSLPRVLISLGVVFALLAGAIFVLKNWTKKRQGTNGGLKIRMLTQHHLGPKKSIAIIQVAGESILIGITDQNISMLKTLSLIDDEIPTGQPNKFDDALYNYEEEAGEIGKHFSQAKEDAQTEPDDFALRGISEIRDVVSRRLKGMRQLE